MFRSSTRPFAQAREVLEELQYKEEASKAAIAAKDKVANKNSKTKMKIKSEPTDEARSNPPDILDLCSIVQKEVLQLGGGKGVSRNSSSWIRDQKAGDSGRKF